MDKQMDIKITITDAEIIMKALIKLPYEQVSMTIASFDKQVREQLAETVK